eukprot:869945_1
MSVCDKLENCGESSDEDCENYQPLAFTLDKDGSNNTDDLEETQLPETEMSDDVFVPEAQIDDADLPETQMGSDVPEPETLGDFLAAVSKHNSQCRAPKYYDGGTS